MRGSIKESLAVKNVPQQNASVRFGATDMNVVRLLHINCRQNK